MRRIQRIVLLAGLVALTPVLSGCESFDMDKLDVFGLSEKKKLPGERKPVFPEGVPGVTQGIPPEYIRGNQPAETAVTLPVEPEKKTAVAEPAAAPKPKPKAKPKPKPATASAPAPVNAQPAPAAQPQPAQQPAQQPWPAPSQSTGTAPWPSAPPPGTFTR